jgi:Ala-tRNA(Pro) deacylase
MIARERANPQMDRSQAIANGVPPDILDALEGAGLAPRAHFHPPVHTVEEAREHWKDLSGAHTKNLFFKDAGGRLWLLTALSERRLDLKRLPQIIGSKRLSFGSAELLERTLGVRPGSVSPLAALRDREGVVTVVLDAALMSFDLVNMHPCENTATIALAPGELRDLLKAHGHSPVIADLDG